MGKPFKRELALLNDTYNWAKSIDLNISSEEVDELISNPTFAVGSGGSFSACHMFAILHQTQGGFSKAVTPLELHYSYSAIRNSNVVFLSASGKNSDILIAYKTAIKNDPLNVLGICMKAQTPLSELAKFHSISKIIEYNSPSGKDGFLATNSLIAYFTLLSRIFGFNDSVNHFGFYEDFLFQLKDFVEKLDPNFTITVLYAGWGQPVAVDIESKFTEAGLGNILLSDFRNFGHGRHNWFDKKKSQSAIIALITPEERQLAEKTLSLLPDHISVLRVSTNYTHHLSTIDLLIQSFQIANIVGEKVGIDPGKPGVQPYGSKLYNLRYQSIIQTDRKEYKIINAILRKTAKRSFEKFNEQEKYFWKKSLYEFKNKINNRKYGAIILDYDGTVCSKEEKKTLPSESMINTLNTFLENGFIFGIVTGRGKSIRETLQKFISKKYWDKVIVGYYNGGDIAFLNDDTHPDVKSKPKVSLQNIYHTLSTYYFYTGSPTLTLRPLQLTIESNQHCDWTICKRNSLELIAKSHFSDIQILESGHSIDVISKPEVSKTNILNHCIAKCKENELSENYICIGDKGQYPGNDYELLMSEVSLSVDEVSSDPTTCWNLSEQGNRGASSCLQYLQSINFHKNYFTLTV